MSWRSRKSPAEAEVATVMVIGRRNSKGKTVAIFATIIVGAVTTSASVV